MAVSQTNSGTQTATISTEHTLATITTAGVYILVVNMTNMAGSDELTLRAKEKVLTGSTSAVAHTAMYKGVQADKTTRSIPIECVHELVFTLQQTAGTGRSFEWSVRNLQA